MQTITVQLANKSYPIYIGSDLLSQQAIWQDIIQGRRALLVSNEKVGGLYAGTLTSAVDHIHKTCLLPDGEQYKTLSTLNLIFDALLQGHYTRQSLLIALGGGVIGDITGFGAACYQRGIDYIQVPTTLLAQVDSSVGGKTAVNHPLGKNMIGAFCQPKAVIIDVNTLDTLDDRQFKAGLAEVVKYGLIFDAAFFNWLERHIDAILNRSKPELIHMITRACQLKADVVARDEFDTTGERALLNFGHTFGHGLERLLGYGTWLHGEAVAAGMMMASDLSCRLNWISQDDDHRIEQLLVKIGLPTRAPASVLPADLLSAMAHDKKREDNALPLILLQSIGQACLYRQASEEHILNAITRNSRV